MRSRREAEEGGVRVRGVLMAITMAAAFVGYGREWFDGGIGGSWPDFTKGGIWRNCGGSGYAVGDAIRISAGIDDPMLFTAYESRKLSEADKEAHFTTELVLGYHETLPDVSQVGRAALAVVRESNGEYAYHVLEKDGATNRWARVGGTPDVTKRCRLDFDFVASELGLRVTYSVDGQAIAVRYVAGEGALGEIGYAGDGEVTSLVGTYESEKARFEVAATEGCLVGEVHSAGQRLAYPYEVKIGSEILVEYHTYGDYCFANGETTVTKRFKIESDNQQVELPIEAKAMLAVAKVGNSRFVAMSNAVARAQSGDVITMLADCGGVGTLTLAGKGEVTLDLNGHKVDGDGNGPLLRVGAGTQLTIVNGDVADADALRQSGESTLVEVDGGVAILDGRWRGGALDSAGAAFECKGEGAVTIRGGAVFGGLNGGGFSIGVYTNGNRLASARFSQDESKWLIDGTKKLQMKSDDEGMWSVDKMIDGGLRIIFR